jgi:hypothetical protein
LNLQPSTFDLEPESCPKNLCLNPVLSLISARMWDAWSLWCVAGVGVSADAALRAAKHTRPREEPVVILVRHMPPTQE